MQDYIQDVKNAANNNIDKRFPNSSIEHARQLVKEIINHSDKKIYSLSSNFHQDFYKSIESEIVNFLQKPDSEFNLIISNNENGLVTELKEKYTNFKVKQVERNKLPKNDITDEYINYIVNDNNAFRYEYSEKNIDVGIVEAIANFNSPKESDILISNFHSICKD
jgi:hypothetical protein